MMKFLKLLFIFTLMFQGSSLIGMAHENGKNKLSRVAQKLKERLAEKKKTQQAATEDDGATQRSERAHGAKKTRDEDDNKVRRTDKREKERKARTNTRLDELRNRRSTNKPKSFDDMLNDIRTQAAQAGNLKRSFGPQARKDIVEAFSSISATTPAMLAELADKLVDELKNIELQINGGLRKGTVLDLLAGEINDLKTSILADAEQTTANINETQERIILTNPTVFSNIPDKARSFFNFLGTKSYALGSAALNLSAFVIKQGAIGYVTQSIIQASGGGMGIVFLVNLGIAGAPEALHLYQLAQQGKLNKQALTKAFKTTITNTVVRMALAAAFGWVMDNMNPEVPNICLPEEDPSLLWGDNGQCVNRFFDELPAGPHNTVVVYQAPNVHAPQSGLYQPMLPAPEQRLMIAPAPQVQPQSGLYQPMLPASQQHLMLPAPSHPTTPTPPANASWLERAFGIAKGFRDELYNAGHGINLKLGIE